MATKTYNVTAPDGTQLSFDGPDDASQADILAAAQRALAVTQTAKWQATIKNSAATDSSPVQAALASAGNVFHNVGAGVQQLYNSATGNMAANAALASDQADNSSQMAALSNAHPVASAIGTALPYIATAPLSAETLGGNMLTQAIANGVPGALSYGTAQQRATDAGIGALGGAGGVGLGALAGKAVGAIAQPFGTPVPDAVAAAGRLADQGITLTPAQASGSRMLKSANAALDTLPISGKMQQNAYMAQQAQITKALANTFGSDATKLDQPALSAARDALGTQFNDLSAKNTIAPQAVNDMSNVFGNIVDTANKDMPAAAKVVQNKIDDILGSVQADGTIPGTAYKSWDSNIGNLIKNADSGETKYALNQVRNAMRDAMDASISPEDAAQWAKIRTQYANLQTVARATDPATGAVSVPKLVTAAFSYPNAKFNSVNDLGQLAIDLKNTVGNTVANSGTPERTFYTKLFNGSYVAGAGGALGTASHFTPGAVLPIAAGAVGGMVIPPAAQMALNSALARAAATKGFPAIAAMRGPVAGAVQGLTQGAGGDLAQP